MFKKIVLTILVLGLMVGVSYACTGNDCKTTGNVMTSNDGNKGNIFVYDCNQGQTNVGKWVNPSSIPSLKGEKGDTGATGATGSQGIQGVAGQDGYTPIKGTDYNDGEKGEQGLEGLQGVVGQVGEQGVSGTDGKNGETGKEGKQGQRGEKGDTGKGLENRVELIGEVRVFDTRKWAGFVYGGADINNSTGIVGLKVQYKLGKSYEEKRLDELERKINLISETPSNNAELYTDGTITGIRGKF